MAGIRGRRILIDGSRAETGGGFTYLVNVIPELGTQAPEDRFRVLVRSERIARSIPPRPNVAIDLLPDASWWRRILFTYRDIPRLLREWQADLYFSAGELAPLRASCPMIVSFRNPNVYTQLDQGWYLKQRLRMPFLRELSRLASRTCDRVLFVSADSAAWIGDALAIPAARRAVVHHGIDAAAWARGEERSPLAYPYILSVSSIYRYKNFVRLIEAWAALARRRGDVPDLVIIGDDLDPEYSAQMREARAAAGGELAERIHILGEVPYAQIAPYYAHAELFVFPSYLETFGHPLLEAMASGVAIVAADLPVFREIAGDAARYADPHSCDALAGAIEAVLFTRGERERRIQLGSERVRQFGWDATARRLRALFDDVLSARGAQSSSNR
jgi:glycosyltransferase involved in cell wall biosynthesis